MKRKAVEYFLECESKLLNKQAAQADVARRLQLVPSHVGNWLLWREIPLWAWLRAARAYKIPAKQLGILIVQDSKIRPKFAPDPYRWDIGTQK